MRRRFAFLLLPLLIAACAASRQGARDWDFLGQRTVSDRVDHDVIVVTGVEGRFSAIQLRVQRATVDFHKVVPKGIWNDCSARRWQSARRRILPCIPASAQTS